MALGLRAQSLSEHFVVERGSHHPSPVINPLRSSYCDELAFRFLTTLIAFTTYCTFGTRLATFSAPLRWCSDFSFSSQRDYAVLHVVVHVIVHLVLDQRSQACIRRSRNFISSLSLTGQPGPAYVCGVRFPRSSGILLHCTSLPGRFGIGDFGPCAYEFADFLLAAGQKLWQVLPLNPTGYGNSPYQCFSAFAGNPLLLSLERLRDQGLLEESDLALTPPFPEDPIDFRATIQFKRSALRRAAQAFFADASRADCAAFDRFCESASPWLDDFALFMALKDVHNCATLTIAVVQNIGQTTYLKVEMRGQNVGKCRDSSVRRNGL